MSGKAAKTVWSARQQESGWCVTSYDPQLPTLLVWGTPYISAAYAKQVGQVLATEVAGFLNGINAHPNWVADLERCDNYTLLAADGSGVMANHGIANTKRRELIDRFGIFVIAASSDSDD